MKRTLGKFESAAALTNDNFPWYLVGIVRLDSMPAPDILRQALDHIQERHPFLRVRLVDEGGKYYFESGEVPSIPIEVINRQDDNQWLQIVEAALNKRVNHSRGPLVRCITLTGVRGQGEIILVFHHAIVDGASVGSVFHELLSNCAAIESGGKIPRDEPLAPLAPVEEHFPNEFKGAGLKWKSGLYMLRQLGEELKVQIGGRGARKPPLNEQAQGRILHLRIPENLTAALVRQARKERVTLNSALNAAMLLSVHRGLYQGENAVLRYMSMVNLRPYLTPPLSPDELGCCISMLRFSTPMSSSRDFWSLAHEINERIYASSKNGEKFVASAMSERVMRMLFNLRKFRMSTTALSFTGPAKLAASYGSFRVVGLHGFISNFGLGPEYTAHVSLFNEELYWDILYLNTDLDQEKARDIADNILEILEEAGAPTFVSDLAN